MADGDIIRWITVNGVHIPIKDGQSKEDAVKEHFSKQAKTESDSKERQLKRSEAEAKQKSAEETPTLTDNKDFDQFIRDNIKTLRTSHKPMAEIKQDWYELRHDKEIKNLKEMDIEKSIDIVTDHIRSNALTGWFRRADSEYKPEIANSILNNSETLNAGMNIAYNNYRWQFERYSELYGKWIPHEGVDQSNKLSFKDWLTTPQTMYRGTHGQKVVDSDIFMSYTPDRKTAEKFLNETSGGKIETIQIRPIDTWGSYQTTGEQEFLVPAKWLKEKRK